MGVTQETCAIAAGIMVMEFYCETDEYPQYPESLVGSGYSPLDTTSSWLPRACTPEGEGGYGQFEKAINS